MNFILEGNLKQTVLYTYSTIMNFILEGKLCFTETKRLCRITLSQKEIQSIFVYQDRMFKVSISFAFQGIMQTVLLFF